MQLLKGHEFTKKLVVAFEAFHLSSSLNIYIYIYIYNMKVRIVFVDAHLGSAKLVSGNETHTRTSILYISGCRRKFSDLVTFCVTWPRGLCTHKWSTCSHRQTAAGCSREGRYDVKSNMLAHHLRYCSLSGHTGFHNIHKYGLVSFNRYLNWQWRPFFFSWHSLVSELQSPKNMQ